MRYAVALTLLIVLGGCMSTSPDLSGVGHQPGDYRIATEHRFRFSQRQYLLHIPEVRPDDKPAALLIALHGAFGTGEQFARVSGFNRLADEEGFVVAYPEGIGLFGLLQHWNAGHCCGKAQQDQIDDVGFIVSLTRDLQKRFTIDPEKTYVVGMSNGGMLAYRLLAEYPSLAGAGAVVAGAIDSHEGDDESWNPTRPDEGVRLLVVHGKGDQHVPIEGGVSPLKKGDRVYASLEDAIGFWRAVNQCDDSNQVIHPGGTPSIEHTLWDCREALQSVTLDGWGHQWPGPYFTDELRLDHPLSGYDVADVIWRFFLSAEDAQ